MAENTFKLTAWFFLTLRGESIPHSLSLEVDANDAWALEFAKGFAAVIGPVVELERKQPWFWYQYDRRVK